ncbi:MAG: OmpH/Skp family outer membrane protein [Planctomycetota bacterium]|jgi:Skp family chaperone for outer membrane proteins
MKIRAIILSCLIGAVVLGVGYEHSRAESEVGKPSIKIGVISIRKIFQDCQRRKKHDEELRAEEQNVNVKLNELKRKIDAARAGLEAIKPDSGDYLELERDVRQKEQNYQAELQYYEKVLSLNDRQWTKQFYEDILRVSGAVAKQKGFDLVFECSEPDFSTVSAMELLTTIQTHKLLYSAGCADITEEVMVRLDKEASNSKTGGGK